MHVYGMLFSPFDQSWVDAPGFPSPPSASDVGGERLAATGAQSDNWIYSGNDIPPLPPRPPLPYRAFSETFSYWRARAPNRVIRTRCVVRCDDIPTLTLACHELRLTPTEGRRACIATEVRASA
jgi:hypothetical protein